MIVRGPRKQRGYTILDNSLLRDVKLSLEARGLLVWLLSQPPDYHTSCRTIADADGMPGKSKVAELLAEIEAAGYLVREVYRDPDTGLNRTVSTVYETPTVSAPPDNGPTCDDATKPQVTPLSAPPDNALPLEGLEGLSPKGANRPPESDDVAPPPLVKELVTYFVDVSRQAGVEPTGALKARLAGHLKRLHEREGKGRRVLRMAVGVFAEEGGGMNRLDYLVADMEREIAGGVR